MPPNALVAGDIARQLGGPVVDVRRGLSVASRTTVLVPEAAMYKDNEFSRRKDNVGFAWQ